MWCAWTLACTLCYFTTEVVVERAHVSSNVPLSRYFNCSLSVYNARLCYSYLVVSEEWEHGRRWLRGHERQHCVCVCVCACVLGVMPPVMSLSPLRVSQMGVKRMFSVRDGCLRTSVRWTRRNWWLRIECKPHLWDCVQLVHSLNEGLTHPRWKIRKSAKFKGLTVCKIHPAH